MPLLLFHHHGRPSLPLIGALALAIALATGCASNEPGASASTPTVVVTTSILGDVVENVVGDAAEVEVLMPAGVDPHEFDLSAAQVAEMQEADVIVANGLGFEAGMADAVDAAEGAGVPVYEVAPALDPLPLAHGADDEDRGGSGLDPHVFTDPRRMAQGVENLAAALGDEVAALDSGAVRARADAYAADVRATDTTIAEELAAVPDRRRVLVTNHEVFSYFADRYDFEVAGTVIPSGTTLAEPSSQELSHLADTIREYDVPAIFADASSPTELADALADESGLDVQVVPLFSESLGEPGSGAETYLDMVQANADAITDALTGGSS